VPQGKIGVGFIRAGPVTQAIHLPTLARLTDLFAVTHVNDIGAAVATSVAARVGVAGLDRLLEALRAVVARVIGIRSRAQSGDRFVDHPP
jgi:hypothetical protein